MEVRSRVGALMCLGVLINYVYRVQLAYVMIPLAADFNLSPAQQGVLLSAFSWGYVVSMLPAGLLVDRLGSRAAGVISGVGCFAAVGLVGLAGSFEAIWLCRLVLGFASAPLFPANAAVVRNIFPLEARGRAAAVFDAGSYLGIAIASPLVVYFASIWGWRGSFAACCWASGLWAMAWFITHPREPLDVAHPEVGRPSAHGPFTQWTRLFRKRQVLAASAGFFCYNYCKSFFLTWLPTYLVVERGIAVVRMGFVSLLPPLCAIAGDLLAGALTDRLLARGVPITTARKAPLCGGLVLASVVALTPVARNDIVVILILCLSFGSLVAASPGIWAIPGDIAPRSTLVGSIGAIQNMFSNIGGIVAPIITGAMYAWTKSFAAPLVLSGVVTIAGAVFYWTGVGELRPIELDEAVAQTR